MVCACEWSEVTRQYQNSVATSHSEHDDCQKCVCVRVNLKWNKSTYNENSFLQHDLQHQNPGIE